MHHAIASRLLTIALMILGVALGFLVSRMTFEPLPAQQESTAEVEAEVTDEPTDAATPTETIPPSTPLPTLTPSRTLLPPPTFEPPTVTPLPSATPSPTLSPTFDTSISIPGLRGAETPTPSSTPGCEPREDWQLTYTVREGDSIARIAEQYGTYIRDLAAGNCLSDPDFITVGQVLRVPGEAHPVVPAVECVDYELITPLNGTMAVPGSGQLTFNWRGPRAPRNLIRVWRPDGSVYERVVELRQNETIDLADIPAGGTYTWRIYPLDFNFVQVCPESELWSFTKEWAPTPTPTLTSGGPGGLP
ncbi:MAG TPA: LysM peptidoglycan-binding domain-containing protein [Oceanobacillus sp.]|nr:LysM peptidoglycan-binding domain-containing protein [Oceanobacillus sp.]